MTQEKKYDVFISYSRKDFNEVNAFVEMLKQHIPTLDIWFDLDGIESGDEFRDKIISAIKRSRYVLFALSKNSDQSEWTRKELQFAKGKKIKIIPLLLDGVQLQEMDWFLFEFGGLDCIDITDAKQLEKVVKHLAKWTSKELIQNKKDTLPPQPPKQTKHKSWLLTIVALLIIAGLTVIGIRKYQAHQLEVDEREQILQDSIRQDRIRLEQECIAQELKRMEHTHEYIDLGLSVKWATCNVGATKPEDYGDYFAWGETEPKEVYDWSTYKWCNGSQNTLTKYNYSSSDGTVDNKTQLEFSDDAARANWGGSWRMPTEAEQDELREKCTWTWTTQNGVNGYKVTSKGHGKSIFLPAAGVRIGGSLYLAGSESTYLLSSLTTAYPKWVDNLHFNSGHVNMGVSDRCYGYSVRPVCQ